MQANLIKNLKYLVCAAFRNMFALREKHMASAEIPKRGCYYIIK